MTQPEATRQAGPAAQPRQSLLPNLFRTTAFKLTAVYLLVFTLFAGVVLGYVAWNAKRLLDDQIRCSAGTYIFASPDRLGAR